MSSLRPYHAFEIDGNHYVYSVWGMSYRRVSARAVAELALASNDGAAEPGREITQVINDLGLRWTDKVRCTADLVEKDRLAALKAREKPAAIRHLMLFVTQDCNMRCPYCYGDGGGYGSSGPMSEETAFRSVDWLIEQAGDSNAVQITFFGGEPLLNFPLVEKVVVYTRRAIGSSRSIDLVLTTNLSLLDDRILDFLVANKFKVLASFDGPSRIQNRNRPLKNGWDSYDTVVPRVRKLLGAIPGAAGRATLAAGDDPWEVARELLALGFRDIQIQPPSGCLITDSGAASGCHRTMPCPHEALISFYHKIVSRFRQAVARRDAEEARAVTCFRNLARYLPGFLCERDLLRAMMKRRRYFFCYRAVSMVAIAANGDIYPCHRFVGAPAFCMGNVHTGEFSREGFLRSSLVENPECASCWARYMCGGNCQHDNATATGDPLKPDPRSCDDLRARIEYAIHAADCLGSDEISWLTQLGIMEDVKCRVDL